MTAQTITNLGFLSEFVRRHEQMTDRPFCWVLGSGASVQSGIPSGGKLTELWLAEMYEMEPHGDLSIEEWATAETLGIVGFEYANAARSYPWIYQRRFRDYPDLGYAFLEKIMANAEPSFGYSVLAQIMATTRHKVAITTNFDNLVADALSTYTRTFPLVCGHESLTGYIRANLRQPLVAKIHRDLLLAPLSKPDEISSLPKEWTSALTKIFSSFTPIVLGYGGNDGSLMNFLKAVSPIEGGIFWCYRLGSIADPAISEVVERHHGRLVPIVGFDELMLQFWEKLQLPSPLPQLQSLHDRRRVDYQKQFEALTAALKKPAENLAAEEARRPVREAADAAVERLTKEKDWWTWNLRANSETDQDKREAIYRAGLEDFPDSEALTGYFALFLEEVRKDNEEAERLYRRAVQLDPKSARANANLGSFLFAVRQKYDEAEGLLRRAMELDPNSARTISHFASFMEYACNNYDEAERLHRRAFELGPADVPLIRSFATFIWIVRKNNDEAERLYGRAFEVDPNNVPLIQSYANFMWMAHKNNDEAERLYRHAFELDPNDVPLLRSYANFVWMARKNNGEAERLYRRAFELDPNDGQTAGSFGQFIAAHGDTAEAGSYFLRARPEYQNHAGAAFTVWLMNRSTSRDGSRALGRLKTTIDLGFPRVFWSFDDLLATMLPRLSSSERPLAQKLAAAILNESKVGELSDEPLWKAATPIPLSVPWSEIVNVNDEPAV